MSKEILEELTLLAKHRLAFVVEKEWVDRVQVAWNSRLKSTAGTAKYHLLLIELNPKLLEIEQGLSHLQGTVLHEAAHLLAHKRGVPKGEGPHGLAWQKACVDLGIPGEKARHNLPLPTYRQKINFVYVCRHCNFELKKVRKQKKESACLACCRKYNKGRFSRRFLFELKEEI